MFLVSRMHALQPQMRPKTNIFDVQTVSHFSQHFFNPCTLEQFLSKVIENILKFVFDCILFFKHLQRFSLYRELMNFSDNLLLY